jgi:hypothetical protein
MLEYSALRQKHLDLWMSRNGVVSPRFEGPKCVLCHLEVQLFETMGNYTLPAVFRNDRKFYLLRVAVANFARCIDKHGTCG